MVLGNDRDGDFVTGGELRIARGEPQDIISGRAERSQGRCGIRIKESNRARASHLRPAGS